MNQENQTKVSECLSELCSGVDMTADYDDHTEVLSLCGGNRQLKILGYNNFGSEKSKPGINATTLHLHKLENDEDHKFINQAVLLQVSLVSENALIFTRFNLNNPQMDESGVLTLGATGTYVNSAATPDETVSVEITGVRSRQNTIYNTVEFEVEVKLTRLNPDDSVYTTEHVMMIPHSLDPFLYVTKRD